MKDFPKLVVAIIGCELTGILSLPFTLAAIPTWYVGLNKPSFSPPNWLFGPVWSALYFLMGVAFFLVWRQGFNRKQVRTACVLFLAQLTLNFLWSLLFFGLRSPVLGLIDILGLWILIIVTMQKFLPISRPAFWLLLPYLLWVTFACLLNLTIVVLNR